MGATSYVALLRGINVGGRNKVPMAALRTTFEDAGYEDVRTYIQSGNVLFRTTKPARGLEDDIEAVLERHLGYPVLVVVRSHAQLRAIVDSAPDGFGADPDTYYSDALFLKPPLTAKQVMALLELRDGVDEAWPGRGVVYFARLGAQRTKSKLNRIVSTPAYASMTIRSWATTTKLLAMLDGG
jgi:uncharacterized protein (DUF1697 family)